MTWQPDGWNDDMSEAPKDGTRIMFWQKGKKIKIGELLSKAAGYPVCRWKCTNGNFHNPTHWRYLPSPPRPASKRTDSGVDPFPSRRQTPIIGTIKQEALYGHGFFFGNAIRQDQGQRCRNHSVVHRDH